MKLMYYYLSFHYKGDYYGLFSTFIQMLHAKKLSQNTIRVYVSYIKPYLTYLEKLQLSPDQASYQTISACIYAAFKRSISEWSFLRSA